MTNVRFDALQPRSPDLSVACESALRQLLCLPRALFATLLSWQARARQRQRLAELDEHRLRDLGLSRAEAEREAAVPFWRAS